MSVLPFVRGVDFSRNQFKVSFSPVENHQQSLNSTTFYTLCTIVVCYEYRAQLDQFQTKMAEMSNLRWLRLNRSQLGSLPDEIDQFQKLVCISPYVYLDNMQTSIHFKRTSE